MEALGRFYETTISSTYDDTYRCKVCIGPRAYHSVLENHKSHGIRVILVDQHASLLI